MACGHCLAAVRSGIAEWTPNLRASYDAAETTPRSSRCPPTTTAFPFSEGSKSSSTETKKASMSTWKMVLAKDDIEQKEKPWGRILSARRNGTVRPGCIRVTRSAVPSAYARRPRLPRPLIHLHVLPRRRRPGKIPAHAVAHQHLPGGLVTEGLQRSFDRKQQRFAAVLIEFEAGSLPGARIPGFDRLVQAAGGAHNRHSSILQAVNLVQAAGFVARRHQEH